MRLLFTIVLILLSSIIYGQNSTLYQNVNSRAKELKHNLNKTGDTLIFSCARTIFEVVIYNDDFERVVRVRDLEARIPIADVPVGKYMVETLLRDKLIVVTLLRNEDIEPQEPKELIAEVAKPIEKPVAVSKPKSPISSQSSIKKPNLAAAGKKPKTVRKRRPKPEVKRTITKKPQPTYWIVYIINKGTSTEKTERLADQATVDYLIRKIKIDMRSATGRLNELSVWKVNNPTEFLRHKKQNKSDFTNVASDSFKTEPYFIHENKNK